MSRTMAQDPTMQFRFKVEWGINEIGCKTVKGLEKETEVAEYAEGGYKTVRKMPGRSKTGTVTLEHAATKSIYWYELLQRTEGLIGTFRQSLIITEQDRTGKAIRQWTLTEAWISKFSAPELDATGNDVAMESIEIQYEDIIVKSF